jgi:hypothetical protein
MFILLLALTTKNCLWMSLKKKGKVVSVHAMKAYMGKQSIAPPIRNLGTSEVNVKEPLYLLNRKLGAFHRQSGRSKKRENPSIARIQTLDHLVPSLVTA